MMLTLPKTVCKLFFVDVSELSHSEKENKMHWATPSYGGEIDNQDEYNKDKASLDSGRVWRRAPSCAPVSAFAAGQE